MTYHLAWHRIAPQSFFRPCLIQNFRLLSPPLSKKAERGDVRAIELFLTRAYGKPIEQKGFRGVSFRIVARAERLEIDGAESLTDSI